MLTATRDLFLQLDPVGEDGEEVVERRPLAEEGLEGGEAGLLDAVSAAELRRLLEEGVGGGREPVTSALNRRTEIKVYSDGAVFRVGWITFDSAS